jgi:hypothetical protein
MSNTKDKDIGTMDRTKFEQSKNKHNFIIRFKTICDFYGGKGTFDLIPPLNHDLIFLIRYHSIKLQAAKNTSLSSLLENKLNLLFYDLLKKTIIPLKSNINGVTIDEYITLIETLKALVHFTRKEKHVPWTNTFYSRLSFLMDNELEMKVRKMITEIMCKVSDYVSTINNQVFCFEHHFIAHSSGFGFDNMITVQIVKPKLVYILTQNGVRPAFRISWHIPGFSFWEATVKSGYLHLSNIDHNLPIPVYIQSHALHLLTERLDLLDIYENQLNLIHTLRHPVFIRVSKYNYLLEYRLWGKKVGYLSCEYCNGQLLVKTFLFLTNNGTPEGKKLYELTGLCKLDKKYLALDKMSCYINSDISSNKTIESFFEHAGCESLIHLDEIITSECLEKSKHNIVNLIANYIKKDEDLLGLL